MPNTTSATDLTPLEFFVETFLDRMAPYLSTSQINSILYNVEPTLVDSNFSKTKIVHNKLTLDQLKKIVELEVKRAEIDLGRQAVDKELAEAAKRVKEVFSLSESDLVEILKFMPSGIMEEEKVKHFSRAQLEEKILEKTAELRKANENLEKKVEERTTELKKLIAEQHENAKILIRRDLELNKANQKLMELDKIKSNFISIVAHQLRTPLSGIKWTLSMILKGDLGELNNDQRTFLMKTDESNNRMITLINDMLVSERIQYDKLHYGFRNINIVDLIRNVNFEVGAAASKRNITIELKNIPENLPEAYIDPESIRGVLQNLLENAVKYTIDNDKIEVSVEDKKDKLEISIADHGIGIPKEQQNKIFSRFFRAPNAIKKITDGSGLGLYIAKTMVEKNGGTVWFESDEGKGSSFHFTVPVIDKKDQEENKA